MVAYCVRSPAAPDRRGSIAPVDLEHFEWSPASVPAEELGLNAEDRVVLYMGSFFAFSGLDIALEGFPSSSSAPDLRLCSSAAGTSMTSCVCRHASRTRGSGRLHRRHPLRGASRLPPVADVAINPFVPQLLTDVALPHKILQYMAAGVARSSRTIARWDSRRPGRRLRGDVGRRAVRRSPPRRLPSPTSIRRSALAIVARQRAFVNATFAKDASVASLEEPSETWDSMNRAGSPKGVERAHCTFLPFP